MHRPDKQFNMRTEIIALPINGALKDLPKNRYLVFNLRFKILKQPSPSAATDIQWEAAN